MTAGENPWLAPQRVCRSALRKGFAFPAGRPSLPAQQEGKAAVSRFSRTPFTPQKDGATDLAITSDDTSSPKRDPLESVSG
jgi:hypothetical protein